MEEGEEVVGSCEKDGGKAVSADVNEGKNHDHDGFYFLDEMTNEDLDRVITERVATIMEATACIVAAYRRLIEGKNPGFNERTQQGRVA